ncbi:uncharacterized protein [Triticum aestivum]|uniref:uncharacterized protein isoform X2 n=1 Tax=Triticum aestivum TaxID=4565 RepID=UPI001D019FF9|nr:uncharacterized protein LOC123103449 isoform X2 [Triticum aestivum]
MVQREQVVVSHRISHHATRVWCVWVWLCAYPLMGVATQFSSGQRRLAIWIRRSVVLAVLGEEVPAIGAAFPGCFLGGGGSGRRCCFPRLLLGWRRFRPSVLLSPAASWAEEVPAVGAAFPGCFLGGGGSLVHLFTQPPGFIGDMSTIQRPPDVVTKGDLHWF